MTDALMRDARSGSRLRYGVPAIAIDPKGDLGNLLLTFPDLSADSFRPWVNALQATNAGQTPDEFATAQAALWKRGLAKWGQDGSRIAQLRDNVDLSIYTPGSNAGMPVSVLQSYQGAVLWASPSVKPSAMV